MLETFRFGRDNHLIGVLESTAAGARADTVVVVPNAGFVSQAGPFRLHVHLSRQLADRGIPCLRFDLSGLGDSALPSVREATGARKLADIDDAIDLSLEQTGASRVVLVGLCSGATDAHEAALKSRHKIAAIGLLDPVAYPNRLYHIIEWTKKVTSPRRIGRLIRRKLSNPGNRPTAATPPRIHQPRPAEQFVAELEAITAKGTHCLFVYTGGRQYNHKNQLNSILSPGTDRSRVTTIFYPECDHTFILDSHRRVACKAVVAWIEACIPFPE